MTRVPKSALVCRLEIWPHGVEEQKRVLGEVVITRNGGDRIRSHYRVSLSKSDFARHPGSWRRGEVRNFTHLRHGPYDLLLRALAACVGGRNVTAARAVPENETAFEPPECVHQLI